MKNSLLSQRLKDWAHEHRLTGVDLAKRLDLSTSYVSALLNGDRQPSYDVLERIFEVTGLDPNYLVLGLGGRFERSDGVVVASKEIAMIPLFDICASAGPGQELSQSTEVINVPVPSDWLERGEQLQAIRVAGDSMTGINIFHGDIVFFQPGLVAMDGVYVLAIGGALFVKRLEFLPTKNRVAIISENVRYPSREEVEPDTIVIQGKVKGWLHRHPY